MSWINDPDIGAVPAAGNGTVDIGWRSKVGSAVVWDGTDATAIKDFLDDDTLVLVGTDMYRKEESGSLTPVVKPSGAMVVFKPMAGDWMLIDGATFKQEFAYHLAPIGPIKYSGKETSTDQRTDSEREADKNAALGRKQIAAKKAPVKKAPAKKAAAKKK